MTYLRNTLVMAAFALAVSGQTKVEIDGRTLDAGLLKQKADLAIEHANTVLKDLEWRFNYEADSKFTLLSQLPPDVFPGPRPFPARASSGEADRAYRRGQSALERREWNEAVAQFQEFIASGGPRVDGAYYWKAYALGKLGRRDEAIAALAELRKQHAQSRWLDDAKALEVEIKQASGQAVSPENQADEDLKVLAINSLINSDPERAIPLLNKILTGAGSPKLKERALFVLAQSELPQARDTVVQYAKGKGNPDLQYKAVEYLAVRGGKENAALLSEIYTASSDVSIRNRVLHGYMVSRDKDRLFAVARSESNPELRSQAMQWLGSLGAVAELGQLYGTEQSPEVRERILHGLMAGRGSAKLIEIARTEKEPKLRRQAIRMVGSTKSPEAGEALVAIYAADADKQIKQEVLRSLSNQGSAKLLIDLARKETDIELKREAVRMLSNMRTKEAADFMMELLNK